ncbi:hypothetical protein SO802_002553 [Lithocarpus litseifolius]|uniref:Maturase n=1 Tax=Lithocarpus litseifolius TaxID=425828 RepID=A0AAW2DZ81_9ROSI
MPMAELYAYLLENELVTPLFAKSKEGIRTPTPLTSIVIEEIIESPVDSGMLTPKKGQIIPTVQHFSHLILSLLGIIESSLGFVPKGTPVVLAIQVRNKVTIEEIEEFLKTILKADYSVIQQLNKSLAQISILTLLLSSEVHCEALLKVLKETHVPTSITDSFFEGQGLRAVGRGSPALIKLSNNKGRFSLGYEPTHKELFQASRGKKRKCTAPRMSVPHIRANFLASANVIMPEPLKELEDKESDLACIIRLCPEYFCVNTIISSEDDPTSTIQPEMPGEMVGLWTIKPFFVVAPAE